MSKPGEKRQLDIRRARVGDEATVAQLLLKAFEPFRRAYSPGGFAETTAPVDVVRERIEKARVWLALDNGEAVGTVTAIDDEGSDGVYIRSMAVAPNAQGRGVGRRLLEVIEGDARDRGCRRLHLCTTFVLPRAQPLYEKYGFVVTRETPPEEWHDMPGVEMEKKLD